MSINLIETIQVNLQYPPLQKIDPNTQEVVVDDNKPDEHRLSQAAIPAILTGLYKYSTTETGAQSIQGGDISTNWVSLIFGETENEVIQKIATYSSQTTLEVSKSVINIANEAIRLIRENITPEETTTKVKHFMHAQRENILLYLPDALHMGELLNDTTLDDNTNKMEGPVSSLMHKIGSAFNN